MNPAFYKIQPSKSSSKAYEICKEISDQHPHSSAEHNITHQCTASLLTTDSLPFDPPRYCYHLFHLKKRKGGGVSSSQLTKHIQSKHNHLWEASKSKKETNDAIAVATVTSGGPLAAHFKKISDRTKNTITKHRRMVMLYKQACVVIYGRSKNPLTASTENCWREMVDELVGPTDSPIPYLTYDMVLRFIDQEYENMLILMKKVVDDVVEYHAGNKALQIFHDGCTIEQTHFVGAGIQAIHPELGNINFGFCCEEVGHKTHEIADFLKEKWKAIFSSKFEDVIGDCVQDYAALGVGRVSLSLFHISSPASFQL